MRGTGGLKRVVPEELKNYKLNIPTPETQKRIVSRLVEDLKKFELLKQKAVQQIELLKERRISLISNVVTGKVKI
jgi:type I restriction enzyme S subunit